mmetsp:Transcript_61666/g.122010  ORF Transcript_61666/g.122010 Transcript_61666/m.122010 type:complete len:204 (+) Transcript_61666:827-1438(+)
MPMPWRLTSTIAEHPRIAQESPELCEAETTAWVGAVCPRVKGEHPFDDVPHPAWKFTQIPSNVLFQCLFFLIILCLFLLPAVFFLLRLCLPVFGFLPLLLLVLLPLAILILQILLFTLFTLLTRLIPPILLILLSILILLILHMLHILHILHLLLLLMFLLLLLLLLFSLLCHCIYIRIRFEHPCRLLHLLHYLQVVLPDCCS